MLVLIPQGVLACLLLASVSVVSTAQADVDLRARNLRLAIDKRGRITALEDAYHKTNYIATDEVSYLLQCRKYGAESGSALLPSESLKVIERTKAGTKIELAYKGGVKLTVLITPKTDYFRIELIGAEPVSAVSQIAWGPYKTSMRGVIGDCIGLNRSDNYTLGLMSPEPNTDGFAPSDGPGAASYTNQGSSLQLTAFDQTRGRFVATDANATATLRTAAPVPGLTVIGSAAALMGCPAGKSNELRQIEKIELSENLPHPTFAGRWNKDSAEAQKPTIWTFDYNQNNFADYLQISQEMGVRFLVKNGGYSRNWGHFEIDPHIYPGGVPAILADSLRARKAGVGLALYTLTNFLKPLTAPEPYLTPVPDARLQTWKPRPKLLTDLSEDAKELTLQNSEETLAALKAAEHKVIRLDNEMIEFKSFVVQGDGILAKECERGAFRTVAGTHKIGSEARLMVVSGFHNFYPGTLDLSDAMADGLWEILSGADLDLFIADGFESGDELGYGSYGRNAFLKRFYDKCAASKKEALFSGSTWTNYSWHTFSHFTWGEYDTERGFRGTALDARLAGQLSLRNNLMPYKLGQYYPETATAEDVEWLLALSAGWDSGFDFQLNGDKMRANPEYKKIVATMRLWEQARAQNAFTEAQKRALRQTDVQYKLSRKAGGGYDLKFVRFWRNENVRMLPPSVMAAKPVSGGAESVRPCGINWSWTHNPAPYDEAGLSDDLIHSSGSKESSWTINYPAYTESTKSWFPSQNRHFQFVIRLPKDAPCAVKNFKVSLNGKAVEIPVTLQPGQYLSIPHVMEWACVYDEKHQVVGEVFFRGALPKVAKGTTAAVNFSCEPTDAKRTPEVILNVRFQNGYNF